MTMQRGKKLGYALPLDTNYQSLENLKKLKVTECPLYANQVYCKVYMCTEKNN